MATGEFYQLLTLDVTQTEAPRIPARFSFSDAPGTLLLGDERYEPGLITVTVPEREADLYNPTQGVGGNASISLSLDAFPALHLLQRNVRLQRIRATVHWWQAGTAADSRVFVWRGRVSSPVIDDVAGVFTCQLVTGLGDEDGPLPAAYIGDDGRFPSAPDAAKPQAVPVLYGNVTNLPVFRISADPGPSPPAGATNVRFLICGHPTPDFTCQLTDNDQMTSAVVSAQRDVDGRGDTYTYIEVPNTTAGWSASASYFVTQARGWAAPGDTASDRAVERLGDVLTHIVNTYGQSAFRDLDKTRINGAASLLNRFIVGSMFNGAGSVLRTIKARYEAQFPVTFNFSGGRFGWDYAGIPPAERSPVGLIVYRQNAHSKSPLTPVDAGMLRARFALAYRLDGYAGGMTEAIRRDRNNSGACARAEDRWGFNDEFRSDAPDVFDEGTARLLLEEQIRRLTLRRVRTAYVVDEPRWVGLPLFSRVLVSDDERGWDGEPCLIEAIKPVEAGRLQVRLITESGI